MGRATILTRIYGRSVFSFLFAYFGERKFFLVVGHLITMLDGGFLIAFGIDVVAQAGLTFYCLSAVSVFWCSLRTYDKPGVKSSAKVAQDAER